jgi:hypothetical protein
MPARVGAAFFRGQYGGLAGVGKGGGPEAGPQTPRGAGGGGMKGVGRVGQFLGLALPALAILLELNHAISLGQMLVSLVAAICCFWIGRILEAYAGP